MIQEQYTESIRPMIRRDWNQKDADEALRLASVLHDYEDWTGKEVRLLLEFSRWIEGVWPELQGNQMAFYVEFTRK